MVASVGIRGLTALGAALATWYTGKNLQNQMSAHEQSKNAQAQANQAPSGSSSASNCQNCDDPDPNKEDPEQKKRQQKKREQDKKTLDNIKEHITDRDLDAARRELNGEVVATKQDGSPYNHIAEVRDSQRGLLDIINNTQSSLNSPSLVPSEIEPNQQLLGEASRLLDRTEQFVPRN